MVKPWVTPSFKEILRDNCREYLDSNDLGKSKDRTAVVDRVAEEIAQVAAASNQVVPEMLNKVFEFYLLSPESCSLTDPRGQAVSTWFGNEARAVVGEAVSGKTKAKGAARRIITGKVWNHRTVAAELHQDRLEEFQKQFIEDYEGDGNPAMRTYCKGNPTTLR